MACGLCREERDLLDSHLMPRALYKLMRSHGEANPHPIVVRRTIAMKTPKQASDAFLCAECERRLNDGGEAWVLAHCWRGGGEFALLDALKAARPTQASYSGFAAFEADGVPGIQAKKLVYFAAGVFWRAAAREWGRLGGEDLVKLELGPYEERLRRFVVGAADFPEDVVIVVTVSGSKEPERNEAVIFPFLKNHEAAFRSYKFAIPGITFSMLVGRGLSAGIRNLCTWRSPKHRVYMSTRMEDVNLNDMARLISAARAVGSLADENHASRRAPEPLPGEGEAGGGGGRG